MAVTNAGFLLLLAAVGIGRLIELAISRRRQRALVALGAAEVWDPQFFVMVLLHTVILLGAGIEVVVLHRPFVAPLAAVASLVFIGANAVRWWVIASLGRHWNVRVINSTGLGIVSSGPFAYVRHPNYAAVFVELLALPLIHTAWLTAIAGSLAHVWVLSRRIRLEEPMLLADSTYRSVMSRKPRFVPKPFHMSRGRAALVAVAVLLPLQITGEPVSVRYREGIVHGFLVLRALDGGTLADGDLLQAVRGNTVTSRLAFRFTDGSLHDETAVFSEAGQFRLLTDQMVQKGPTFPRSIDMSLDAAKGDVVGW